MRGTDAVAGVLAIMVVAFSALMLRCCWLSRRVRSAITEPFLALSRDPDWRRAREIWRQLEEGAGDERERAGAPPELWE